MIILYHTIQDSGKSRIRFSVDREKKEERMVEQRTQNYMVRLRKPTSACERAKLTSFISNGDITHSLVNHEG